MYSMATISEDVVSTSGVTFDSYLDDVEVFLGDWTLNTNLTHAVGTVLGPQPNECQTDVDFNGTKRGPRRDATTSNKISTTVLINGRIAASLQDICNSCEARVFSTGGRLISRHITGTALLEINQNIPSGIYFIAFYQPDGTVSTRKFVYAK